MTLTTEQALQLEAPLAPEDVFFRIQSTKKHGTDGYRMVCYTTRHAVRRRLNQVIPGQWSYTFEPLVREEGSDALIECRGVIWYDGQRYEGLGTAKGKKERPSKSPREISKECVGDGLKLAGVCLGVAAHLYTLPRIYHHVGNTDDGVNERELDDLRAIYAELTGQAYTRRYEAPAKQQQQSQTQQRSSSTGRAPAAAQGAKQEQDMSRDDFLKALQALKLPVPEARALIGVESFEGLNLRDTLARVKEAHAKAQAGQPSAAKTPGEKRHDGPVMSDDDRASPGMIHTFKAEIERPGRTPAREWADVCIWIPKILPSKHTISNLTVAELRTVRAEIARDDAERLAETPNVAPPFDLVLTDEQDVVGDFVPAGASD
jgi:ribosomal protein L12E/L44/L45/RPP1/RPP2